MLCASSTNELKRCLGQKNLIAIGAGRKLIRLANELNLHFTYAVDSDPQKDNSVIEELQLKVHSWEYLFQHHTPNDVYLITPNDYEELYDRVSNSELLKDNQVHIYALMRRMDLDEDLDSYERRKIIYPRPQKQRIPKVIHYTWFSGEEMPDLYKRCVESWSRYCPDYQIVKWDKDNYDYRKNRFCREAIENRKWAFASDYARADIIYHHGGIYLDTDVELVRNIDELLYQDAYIGFQGNKLVDPGSGFGAVTRNPVIGEFLSIYDDKPFVKEDGSFDLLPCPNYYTEKLIAAGLKRDGSYQLLDHIAVYPFDYFCPHSTATDRMFIRDYTYSIHHHAAAWLDEQTKMKAQRETGLIHQTLETV